MWLFLKIHMVACDELYGRIEDFSLGKDKLLFEEYRQFFQH